MPIFDVGQRADTLRRVVSLLTSASEVLISEWQIESEVFRPAEEALFGEAELCSARVYDAQRTIAAALGKIEELTSDPHSRIFELTSQYYEAIALRISAEHRIPDLLAESENGVDLHCLSAQTGIEERKLGRVLRMLVSEGIFAENLPGKFVNNRISAVLVKNEPIRSSILLRGKDLLLTAYHLPEALTAPGFATSYESNKTAFQLAHGTDLPFFAWLSQKIPAQTSEVRGRDDGHEGDSSEIEMVHRPQLEQFTQGMMGRGKARAVAHLYDFPWDSLGRATMVDVGAGVGGFCLQLSRLYPDLRFVVQDQAHVIARAEQFWKEESQSALDDGIVRLMIHDFFEPNPVTTADVYFLQGVLHDWSDADCVRILSSLAKSIGRNARVLIAEQLMNTTLGDRKMSRAPDPLPANYGQHSRSAHQRDMTMMSLLNGTERTPAEFEELAHMSGLKLTKIWETRSSTSIQELRLL